jgi:hypothetical protein
MNRLGVLVDFDCRRFEKIIHVMPRDRHPGIACDIRDDDREDIADCQYRLFYK